jgi:hypothetical protein
VDKKEVGDYKKRMGLGMSRGGQLLAMISLNLDSDTREAVKVETLELTSRKARMSRDAKAKHENDYS